jgi:hypothetical protein
MSCGPRFVGGPLDGELSPDGARARWRISGGHAYFRTDAWHYVGVECDGCSVILSAGSDGRFPESCPLCGCAVQSVRRAEASGPWPPVL